MVVVHCDAAVAVSAPPVIVAEALVVDAHSLTHSPPHQLLLLLLRRMAIRKKRSRKRRRKSTSMVSGAVSLFN